MRTSAAWLARIDVERYLGPADVLAVGPAQDRARVRLAGSRDMVGTWAQIAMAGDCELRAGDRALVIGESPSGLYVIGLLRDERRATPSPAKLTLVGGAYATTTGPEDKQVLRVFSGRDELVFEYDESGRTARVNVDCGDIQFVAKRGNIEFVSGQDVVIQGRTVGIAGASEVRLATGGRVRLVAERIESMADTVIERAKNVYRVVERLSQLKTGRLRTLVDSTLHLKARRTVVSSDEDCKIAAKQIHLG